MKQFFVTDQDKNILRHGVCADEDFELQATGDERLFDKDKGLKTVKDKEKANDEKIKLKKNDIIALSFSFEKQLSVIRRAILTGDHVELQSIEEELNRLDSAEQDAIDNGILPDDFNP